MKSREDEWPEPAEPVDLSISLATTVLLNYYGSLGYDRKKMQDYLTQCLRNPPDSLRSIHAPQ